ncbi:NAD(P)/FAD-dependent oxidoreductase [Paenibacillus sp. J2TS4]|uniref:NAD(P)/FAD-dependent oxidoreductase n=1 Tax=Paenibacillus sp. J2TS4 TaxID=2807194 RepID=UPI001B077B5D|nr:NAD(P)/FAD-dependent oxidoreductase [Paenibacillus sp. J2TS4]GIP32237.1 FAD-dependent oxidoreductase [Paenibacillus sp. J2TS4]
MYDVAVLGGGIAGGSMAAALAGMGWHTVLIDQSTFPRHKVCGEFLSPESRNSLSSLGLEPRIRSLQPVEMNSARLHTALGNSLDIPLPGAALGVSRYALDHALHQAALDRGAETHGGMTVLSVNRAGERYEIEIRGRRASETIEARAVIGAWGRNPRSGLASSLEPAGANRYVGVKSHYDGLGMEPVVELYLFSGGYLGICPVEGGRHNVAALMTRDVFQQAGKSVQGAIEMAACLNPALRRRLALGEPVSGTEAAVSPVRISRKPAAWGKVPHIGDAALVIPPLCGDGMAIALHSVVLCSRWADEFLCGRMTLSDWRHNYTQAMRRDCSSLLRWGKWFQRLFGNRLLSPILIRTGNLMPHLAYRMVLATRLKSTEGK